MLDDEALILIAHPDGNTLLAIYSMLDAEGYFVAPCFSNDELLRYCTKYQPDLVMTSSPSSEGGTERLLENIRERSSKTKVLILPDVLLQRSEQGPFEVDYWSEEILRFAATGTFGRPSLHRNGV